MIININDKLFTDSHEIMNYWLCWIKSSAIMPIVFTASFAIDQAATVYKK